MEQLKHSEEQIIKLGKKLIKELDLVYSVNTMARWMSHYLAELIHNAESAVNIEEKKILQKECCDIILKIWREKDVLPIRKPLDDLSPLVEILQVLTEEKEIRILPRWVEYRSLPRKNQWASFVDVVKNNTEKVFDQVMQMHIHKDLLAKDKEWMQNNMEFLSSDQINFIKYIDLLAGYDFKKGLINLNDFQLSDDNEERMTFIFNNLEQLLNEQKNELIKIKESYFSK
ncbi:hypothetical protein [Flavobacterium hibernum]|uniref:Uncharacterized protein n=1 Tax=Flavobacterium hibernum TaxID=37752 RepID=A0A0D0F8T9_9FLAO|nr:hypothetical protein [Flavobacterium hibernum]KIO54437.1 hypothetical protein IW18_03035 [Flavobacterium hibernum]OXA88091.1 hypothetical protein B0A73_09955 [Flavobacterium hibernum]STO10704.1 Uncharacterised protein [Flavobacterium hibernum]